VNTEYIFNLRDRTIPDTIGAKANNLRFLIKKRLPIPETYVCTWDAHLHSLKSGNQISDIIRDELLKKIDVCKHYAVRSSANIEDGQHYSFAGQFKTILNVKGLDNIIEAIESIWSSTYSKGVKTYLKRIGVNLSTLKMAVIIQEMVHSTVSGVSFSKNPVTGMDEIIVEATNGNGENLLQNGITPERWVNKWGEWIAQPDNGTIDPDIIRMVVAKTKEIAQAYGSDVDVEWVYDGNKVNWVQLREITSLKNTTLYSNHFAREVFPGIIKPLIWSINVPLVCGAWIKFFTELIGKNDINPRSLAKSFHYRAYFNMGTIGRIFEALGFPSNTIELLMEIESNGSEKPSFKPTKKTLTLLPRMIRCAFDKVRFARKIKAFLPAMKKRYLSLSIDRVEQLNEKELIAEIKKLHALNEETAYYMIITYLLMGLYNGVLKYQLKKCGVDFENFDLMRGMNELIEFDPTTGLAQLNTQFNQLDKTTKNAIKKSSYHEFLSFQGFSSFQKNVENFIAHFGHLSDSSNDFSSIPWRENPDSILSIIVNYTQRKDKSAQKIDFGEINLPPLQRLLLTPLHRRARNFRFYREAVGFLYTFGYGLFRTYFLALANHFVRRGFITNREDIFYLYYDEIKEIVKEEVMEKNYVHKIAQRKQEIMEHQEVNLPHTIYGDHLPPLITSASKRLKGIPTSKGVYKGKMRVIKGFSDFHKLREGDVLVIPYSDVAWTPLFTKAGAIIAESGGFLSHSSIIAREYEIPAIVSVPEACSFKDDTVVTVDGFQGEIIIG